MVTEYFTIITNLWCWSRYWIVRSWSLIQRPSRYTDIWSSWYYKYIEFVDFLTIHFTHLQIPELDFEIPPEAQRGTLSTVCFIPYCICFVGKQFFSKCFSLVARLLILYLVNQVEGIIMRAVDELQALQDERKVNLGSLDACLLEFELSTWWRVDLLLQKVDPQRAEAIDQFLLKLKSLGSGEAAFTFILDDPAGNSFIENP